MRSKLALAGIVVCGVCALSMGCSSSTSPDGGSTVQPTPVPTPEPTPEPAFSWTGTFRGTVTEATLGTAPAEIELEQSGSAVTGQASIDFGGQVGELTGVAVGTVTDTTLSLDVGVAMPGGESCAIHLEGTRSGDTVEGTLAQGTCTYPFAGTFSVTKV